MYLQHEPLLAKFREFKVRAAVARACAFAFSRALPAGQRTPH